MLKYKKNTFKLKVLAIPSLPIFLFFPTCLLSEACVCICAKNRPRLDGLYSNMSHKLKKFRMGSYVHIAKIK